jgi:sulfopyruvate decarboxylase subunit beta
MLTREQVIILLLRFMCQEDRLISCLGNMSRALYAAVDERLRSQCFFCMGSMGSVVPLALGLNLANSPGRVIALEGDGGILMNLGSLVSVRRYGDERLWLLIWDNACYESTGGQPSQPLGFDLARLAAACQLDTWDVNTEQQMMAALKATSQGPRVLILRGQRGNPAHRIPEDPETLARRFQNALCEDNINNKLNHCDNS